MASCSNAVAHCSYLIDSCKHPKYTKKENCLCILAGSNPRSASLPPPGIQAGGFTVLIQVDFTDY